MKKLGLGVQSINCVIKSSAKAYGFDIFTYNPKTELIDTMRRKDSSVFLKTIIRQIPSCRYIDVIIKFDKNVTSSDNESDVSQILSQANDCVEEINDQGFLII